MTLTDRTEYEAEVVGRDAASDLALLKITPRRPLPFVRFANSTRVRVGDWVVAIGNPFGLGGTVTAGIVSALHRNIGAGLYDRFIQTDASINSGNSGGPMFDLNGNVVGIATALFSPTGGNVGIGFGIPAEQARPVIEALRRGQRVQRGYIGVAMQDVDEGVAAALGIDRNRGVLIRSVTPGGPADRGGVRQGDVVISVAGQPVTPDQSLAYLVAQQPVGARIPLEIIRQGQRRNVSVAVAERPSEEELARLGGGDEQAPEATDPTGKPTDEQSAGQRSTRQSLGLSLQTLTPALARQMRIAGAASGLVVASVDPNSDAGQKGIQPGDVILSINQTDTPTPEAAAAAVEAARRANRNTVLLQIRRGNTPPAYVGVELAQALRGWRRSRPGRRRGDARAHSARRHPGRRHHPRVHRRQRLSRPSGRPDLRHLDPGRRHLDGGAALVRGRQHPRKQYRPDRRLGGGHAGGDHLRPARAGDDRLVERLSLLDDRLGDRGRRHTGGDVLGAAAARARRRYAAALSRRAWPRPRC